MNKLLGTTKGKDSAWIGDHWGTHGFGYCPAPSEMGSVKFWALVVLLWWCTSEIDHHQAETQCHRQQCGQKSLNRKYRKSRKVSERCRHPIKLLLLSQNFSTFGSILFFCCRKKHNCCDLHLFKSELLVRLTSRRSFFASYDFYQII